MNSVSRLPSVALGAVKTHCPYCAFQCGMVVTNTPAAPHGTTVEADEEFPVNRGQMCIKGFTSAALLDHPARVKSPMLRQRDGRLAPVDWDTALAFVADRLLALRREHGPSALAAFGSGALTNEKAYLLGKFARVALRTPNVDLLRVIGEIPTTSRRLRASEISRARARRRRR